MGTFYDSASGTFPAGTTEVALYRNGLYAFPPSEVSKLWRIRWIDVDGDNPAGCSILDIETGDASPGMIPGWCSERDKAVQDSLFRLYCNLSTWPAVKAIVRTLPYAQKRRVRYWIANPTGVRHLVPGSSATQYEWGENTDTNIYSDAWELPK
jgi:hypothetical protein